MWRHPARWQEPSKLGSQGVGEGRLFLIWPPWLSSIWDCVHPKSGAKVPMQKHLGQGPLAKKQNQHTSPRGQLLRDRWETEIAIPRGSVPKRFMGISGRELGVGGCLWHFSSLGGCLSVCLQSWSRAPQCPFPPCLYPCYFPWASVKVFPNL